MFSKIDVESLQKKLNYFMKADNNKCFMYLLLIIPTIFFGQTGINTINPQGVFHVDGAKDNVSLGIPTVSEQINDFIITQSGNVGIGTITPGAVLDVNGNAKIRSIEDLGTTPDFVLTLDANNVIRKVLVKDIQPKADATRFLGGSVYVRFGSSSTGDLYSGRIIGKKTGSAYTVGNLNLTSSIGALSEVKGQGYTVSNPSEGIYDIMFDVPLQEIYGISVNIVDAYSNNTGQTWINDGAWPRSGRPGMLLKTNDNAQVSFISNNILRIKTGDNNGNTSNRSFTFLVTGK